MLPNKKFRKYVFLSIAAAVLAAPNTLIIKIVSETKMDDMSFIAIRGAITILVCLPLIIKAFPKILLNWKWILVANIFVAIAVLTHVPAIRLSTASYVSVLHLFAPIIFVTTSTAVIRERLNIRKVLGIAVAFIGAFIMFAFPLFAPGGTFQFYSESTILSLTSMLAFAFAMISYRKLSNAGVPVLVATSVSFVLVTIMSATISLTQGGFAASLSIIIENPWVLALIIYSAAIVETISHSMSTRVYKKIGSFMVSAGSYAGRILAVILPVLILQESLSLHMIIGAAVAICGVIIVDTKSRRRTATRA